MTPNHDTDHDPLLAALRDLPAWDVHGPRARQLGARCRLLLGAETRATAGGARSVSAQARWPRVTAIAFLTAWCAMYLAEVVRRGAAAWGL